MPARKRAVPKEEAGDDTSPATKRQSTRQSGRKDSRPIPSYRETSEEDDSPPVKLTKKGRKPKAEVKSESESLKDVESSESETEAKPIAPSKRASKAKSAKKDVRPKAKTPIAGAKKDKKPSKSTAEKKTAGGDGTVSDDPDVDSIPAHNPDIEHHDGEWYWLMKAEPETRLENGIDVSFSIDDLRAKEKPEPWDGESGRALIWKMFADLI